MPSNRRLSQGAFDATMLDPHALDTPEGLSVALRAIEAICHRGSPDIARMLATLNSRSYLLEYIISGALRVTIGPRTLPMLTVLLSSAGGGGVRKALAVDSHRISHLYHAKHDGNLEYAAPSELLILVAIRGVSVRCRYTPQPPRVPEKNRTLVRYSQDF